jgi:hypothetical protein
MLTLTLMLAGGRFSVFVQAAIVRVLKHEQLPATEVIVRVTDQVSITLPTFAHSPRITQYSPPPSTATTTLLST